MYAQFNNSNQMTGRIFNESINQNLLFGRQDFSQNSIFNSIEEFDMNKNLPKKVIGDPDRLIQVAINIIGNAIQNTYNSGKIVVFVHYDFQQQKIIFIVNDNGTGITDVDQRTIYNFLGTMPKTYNKNSVMLRDGQSIGLGLFLCKQITMQFQGDLELVSRWQIGSTFIFSMKLESNDDDTAMTVSQLSNELQFLEQEEEQ